MNLFYSKLIILLLLALETNLEAINDDSEGSIIFLFIKHKFILQ
jgi:hypothetical protein